MTSGTRFSFAFPVGVRLLVRFVLEIILLVLALGAHRSGDVLDLRRHLEKQKWRRVLDLDQVRVGDHRLEGLPLEGADRGQVSLSRVARLDGWPAIRPVREPVGPMRTIDKIGAS
jgi:hypothetical protein